jgi:hypothetical protein
MNLKVLKKMIVLLMLGGCLVSCSKDEMNISHPEELLYYNSATGKRELFTKMDGKFSLVFYTKDENKLRTELALAGIEFPQVEETKEFNSYSLDPVGSGIKIFRNYKSVYLVEGDYKKAAAALSHSLYWAPYYKSENGKEMCLSEGVLVKLHSTKRLAQVERLAKKYAVEMMGANKYLPGEYMLVCTNRSKGNALEMAVIFYDSGLFEYAAPDFIYTLNPH